MGFRKRKVKEQAEPGQRKGGRIDEIMKKLWEDKKRKDKPAN